MGIMSAVLLLIIYVVFALYIFGRASGHPIAESVSDILANINEVINQYRFLD